MLPMDEDKCWLQTEDAANYVGRAGRSVSVLH